MIKTKLSTALLTLIILANYSGLANAEPPPTWTEVPEEEVEIDGSYDTTNIRTIIVDNVINFFVKKLGVEKYLNVLNQDLSEVVGDIETFLSRRNLNPALGKVGLPNIQEVKKILEDETVLNELSDVLGSQTGSNFSNKQKLYQQYLKDVSQQYSENSALSLSGQSKIDAKIETIMSASEQSNFIAEDSSGQDISQNILRNVSNQLAINQQSNAMIYGDLQDAKIDRSLGLQIDAETLTEVSKSNQHREREMFTAINETISSSSMVSIPGIVCASCTTEEE